MCLNLVFNTELPLKIYGCVLRVGNSQYFFFGIKWMFKGFRYTSNFFIDLLNKNIDQDSLKPYSYLQYLQMNIVVCILLDCMKGELERVPWVTSHTFISDLIVVVRKHLYFFLFFREGGVFKLKYLSFFKKKRCIFFLHYTYLRYKQNFRNTFVFKIVSIIV